MDKFYSYADFLNSLGQNIEEVQQEQLLNEIYLDLFLKRLNRLHRIEQLYELIDVSLDERNEQQFYSYTEELLILQSK
jgi:uncharacterized protein YpiB (UPF0302 family)